MKMNPEQQEPAYSLTRLAQELGTTFHGQKRFKGALRSRERFVHALFEIIRFLDSNGVHPLICMELNELCLGLIELDRGAVRHFLKPNKAGSKAVDADDVWRARALLASALDLMVVAGASRKSAAREIAKDTALLACLVSKPNGSYAEALEQWHIAFEKQKVKSNGALLVFNDRQSNADIYRRKIENRDHAPETIEKLVVSSFLRDATFAAVRAADPKRLEAAEALRTKTRL